MSRPDQPVAEELLPPEKMLVPSSGQPIDFRVELKRLLDSIMANYAQFMEMLVRFGIVLTNSRFDNSVQQPDMERPTRMCRGVPRLFPP